jgi:DNA-binding FadR family transcriptional regulator
VERHQLRQPSIADMIASELRNRILRGELRDGDTLPKQEELLEEFGVSKPSVREAFRILETEGLITVRRGNVGGSVVHVPQTDSVTYMLALVLEARSVSLADAGAALQQLEPAAAALCANRADRATEVVPRLRAAHDDLERALDANDEMAAIQTSRAFHELLVELCGNETMRVVVGTLEGLWSAHEAAWAVEATLAGHFPDPAKRVRSLDEHAEILRLIEAGDGEGVLTAARRHLEASQQFPLGSSDRPIDASATRSSAFR